MHDGDDPRLAALEGLLRVLARRLRILQVIGASTNDAVKGNRVWLRNLHDPLLELGHDVVLVNAEEGRRAMQMRDTVARERFSEYVLSRFKREHLSQPFDLFFAYLMDGMIEVSVIDEIRRVGVPTCNFSCNNIHQFGLVDDLSNHFDLNLHSERDVADKFRGVGATPFWWPMASNPHYARPMPVRRQSGLSFVGGSYGMRADYALHLIENGIDLHLYGPRWTLQGRRARAKRRLRRDLALGAAVLAPSLAAQHRYTSEAARIDVERRLAVTHPGNVHEPVSDEEVIRLYSSSRVSLGFLEVFDNHDPSRPALQHLHLREFEAPMSGALYLTNFSDELGEMFELEKEVLVWRNRHELLEKARFYGEHPKAGEKIRKAARRRALACHTYQRRFQQLFSHLGLT
jgi:spore maturation protein CgeB